MTTYNLANKVDVEAIACLLEKNKLPFSDIGENVIDFIVGRKDCKIIGCVGMEKYGDHGLLRSFAVDSECRNPGVGKELYYRILKRALQFNIKTMHLLTDSANEYFSKVGFVATDRKNAPLEITKTAEFSRLCTVSSTYMVLEDIAKYV